MSLKKCEQLLGTFVPVLEGLCQLARHKEALRQFTESPQGHLVFNVITK